MGYRLRMSVEALGGCLEIIAEFAGDRVVLRRGYAVGRMRHSVLSGSAIRNNDLRA